MFTFSSKFKIAGVCLLACSLLTGVATTTAATPKKKATTTKKVAPKKKPTTALTPMQKFVKSCDLVCNDGDLNGRKFKAKYKVGGTFCRPGYDEEITGVISFSGNFNNPDYLMDVTGIDTMILRSQNASDPDYYVENYQFLPGRWGSFVEGIAYKWVNFQKQGPGFDFEMSLE